MIRQKDSALLAFCVLLLSGCGQDGAGHLPTLVITQEPAAAPALPATEVDNAAFDGPMTSTEAFRLLEQATFGAQLDDIKNAASIGPESWINEQMLLPATYLSEGLQKANSSRWNEYVNVWWRLAIQADDQLRQRVAFALSQILVVSAANGLGQQQMGLANYYDILLRHAFGNYRDLLGEITINPVMGEYLSMKGNSKPDSSQNIEPDENYARELLQLFSIGQVMLNDDGTPQLGTDGLPLPAYDQNTIQEYARVFTGWHFANADDFRWPRNSDYLSPMKPWEAYHDSDAKSLLMGAQIPAGTTAREALNLALDSIFNHPNVGPFVSDLLIKRLVTSNPSPGYVRDVAAVFNNNYAGERGSLASTIKAILMHQEARQGHMDTPETFGKLKEPLLRMTQLWRAFEPATIHYDFNYGWVESDLNQAPLNSPSVFNFYSPDYSLPGEITDRGLTSPEFQILNETSIISITNRLLANTIWSHNYQQDSDSHRIALDITKEVQLEADKNALLDHLDLLLLGGRMSPGLRAEVEELMQTRKHNNAAPLRITETIFLIATSPEAAIQQ